MKSLHTIQRARLLHITMQKLIEASISRLTFILFRFHNYTTLPINQANLNHFDRFTISRLFFEPVNFLLSGPPTSAPRRSTFQETIHPPRPLLDVPRDAPPAHPARTVTEVDLSSPPLQRGAHHRHPCAATRARTDAASPKNHAPIVPLIESQASACAPVASKNFTARPFNWSRRRARGGADCETRFHAPERVNSIVLERGWRTRRPRGGNFAGICFDRLVDTFPDFPIKAVQMWKFEVRGCGTRNLTF